MVGGIFRSSCRVNDNTPPSDCVEVCVVDTTTWVISIMKTPPVEGTSATSASEVENVERSSCANCHDHISNKMNQLFPPPISIPPPFFRTSYSYLHIKKYKKIEENRNINNNIKNKQKY